MQIGILGPLEVRDATGTPIEVTGARLRALLTRLALDPGRPVGVAALVEAVWDEQPPAEETNALQTLASRLRRLLGDPGVIVQAQGGYRLTLDPDAVDATRFERLARDGAQALRAGDHAQAARLLADALALWRGAALADAAGGSAVAAATRLDDLRLTALVDRIDADLEIGNPSRLVAELEALFMRHPLHERLAGQLIRALAASGRPAEALNAYERLRTRLADELGVDPSPEVQGIHLELLRGELAAKVPTQRRTNLKAQLTSFVGREDEVARIGKSLEQNRLVTLVGPGGAGKTRLASEAAGRILDSAPDGIWLVELAQVTAGGDVPQAVLASVGLKETYLLDRRTPITARDALSRLVEGLVDKRSIIVLDNCEHVIDASARLADHLLAECAELRVLTTSREPLGIFGEALLAVPPLGQPAPTASAVEALEYPAVRLFADRAGAVRPDFEVTDAEVATVIEIVRRLDGLPLAIELAAARLRSLPLDDIAARLTDRFRLLTGGSRTAMPRHRTLRAVVEWSWDLLADEERHLAEQLSVFPAGVTVDSAAAICGLDRADASELLAALIDKSLLQPVDGGRRMRMLETIREYGAERLAERGELAAVRRCHAEYFAGLLEDALPQITTADQLPWFARLSDERENVLAAMRFYCDVGDADSALNVAVGLAFHAMMLGNHPQIAAWLNDALAVPGGADEVRVIGRAIYALNSFSTSAPPEELEEGLQEFGDLARQLGDVDVERWPVVALLRAAVAFFAQDTELVDRYVRDAVEGDDDWARASVLMLRANMAENEGDVDGLRRDTEAALAEFRRLGDRWGMAATLRSLGMVHTLDGRLDEAVEAYREVLRLSGELDSREDEGFMLARLADVELRRGNVEQARRYAQQAQVSADEQGAPIESAFTLAMIGAVERQAGNLERARELQREAAARLAVLPRLHPVHGHMRAMLLALSARLAHDDGDGTAADQHAREAVEAAIGTRDMPILAIVGVTLADLSDDAAEAAVLLGAAARLRGADDLTAYEVGRVTSRLREALGDERFTDLYERGKALDRDAAIERLRSY